MNNEERKPKIERCRGGGAILTETVFSPGTQYETVVSLDAEGNYHYGPGGCADYLNHNGWMDKVKNDEQFDDAAVIKRERTKHPVRK